MIRVEASATIDRPVTEVGRFLGEIERQTEWTDMTAARKLTDGPVRAGTQAYAELAMGPFKLGWTWEVVDYEPDKGITYRTVSQGALGMDGNYRLTPLGARTTRVDAVVDVRTRGLLRLIEPLIRAEVTRNEAGELERLKRVIEADPADPTATAGALPGGQPVEP